MAAPAKTRKTADVVAYARELSAQAARVRDPDSNEHDPYGKPFSPSDDLAYKLVSTMGCEAAYGELVHRAANAKRADDERRSVDVAKERKLRLQHQEEDREQAALLEGLTFGQRMDRALSALSVISEGATASPSATGGGDPQPVLETRPTDAGHAAHVARQTIAQLEEMLQRAARRTMRSPDESRDDRLARFVKSGLNASQIAVADPSQGTVRQIAERMSAMAKKAESMERKAA